MKFGLAASPGWFWWGVCLSFRWNLYLGVREGGGQYTELRFGGRLARGERRERRDESLAKHVEEIYFRILAESPIS